MVAIDKNTLQAVSCGGPISREGKQLVLEPRPTTRSPPAVRMWWGA
jgi:hypothetical protein